MPRKRRPGRGLGYFSRWGSRDSDPSSPESCEDRRGPWLEPETGREAGPGPRGGPWTTLTLAGRPLDGIPVNKPACTPTLMLTPRFRGGQAGARHAGGEAVPAPRGPTSGHSHHRSRGRNHSQAGMVSILFQNPSGPSGHAEHSQPGGSYQLGINGTTDKQQPQHHKSLGQPPTHPCWDPVNASRG